VWVGGLGPSLVRLAVWHQVESSFSPRTEPFGCDPHAVAARAGEVLRSSVFQCTASPHAIATMTLSDHKTMGPAQGQRGH